MFEVLYLKYIERTTDEERAAAQQDVIEMLCSKVQGYMDGEPAEG
jgi:5'-deoxynucleotidase YfbR-like HD superfamily hydrolase